MVRAHLCTVAIVLVVICSSIVSAKSLRDLTASGSLAPAPTPVTSTTATTPTAKANTTAAVTNVTKACIEGCGKTANSTTIETRGNNTITRTSTVVINTVPKTNETKPEPAHGHVKEFIEALHSRFQWDQQEAENAQTEFVKDYNESTTKIRFLIKKNGETIERIKQGITKAEHEIQSIGETVAEIKKQQLPLWKKLNHTRHVYDVTKANWHTRLQSLKNQRDTAQGALGDVTEIVARFKGPEPTSSIREQLAKTKEQYSGSAHVSALLKEATTPTSPESDDFGPLNQQLEALKSNLLLHTTDLWQQLVMANQTFQEHMNKLTPIVEGLQAEVQEYTDKIHVVVAPLPDLHRYIEELKKSETPELEVIKQLNEHYKRLNETHVKDVEVYTRENANRLKRIKALASMHQIVKQQYVSGVPAAINLMNGVKNTLSKRGSFHLDWDSTLGKNTSVDPDDIKKNLCASYKFDEEADDLYVIDSSKNGLDGKLHGVGARRITGHTGRKSGRAIAFDGMGTYVDLGTLGDFGRSMQAFTISMWVRTIDTHEALSSLVKVIDDGFGEVMGIDLNRRVGKQKTNGEWPTGQQSGDDLAFQGGSTLVYLRDRQGRVLAGHVKAPMFDNKWHYLQWTVTDAKLNSMIFFMDGKQIPFQATIEQSPERFNNFHNNVYIGAGNNRGSPEGFFDGAIDQVKFFC
jgi:Concanavalin A-like lectin/glucanases superfamily